MLGSENLILNIEEAVSNMGDRSMYFEMLGFFEKMCLEKDMEEISEGITERDMEKVRLGSFSLRSNVGYISGTALYQVATALREFAEVKDEKMVLETYPIFVQEAIKLKKAIRQALAHEKGELFEQNAADELVPISTSFQILKRHGSFFVYSLIQHDPLDQENNQEQASIPFDLKLETKQTNASCTCIIF